MNISPNQFILPLIFKTCTQLGTKESFEFGGKVFQNMSMSFKRDTVVLTAALNMFIQSGDMNRAEKIFSEMNKNTITHAVMMTGKSS